MTKEEKRYRLRLGRLSIALGRSVVYTSLGFLLFVGLVLTATRVGVPYIVKNKSQIEQLVSDRSGLDISIQKMNVDWDKLFPGIEMYGLRVSTADGGLVTEAERVSASITPVSLLTGKVGLATLTVHGAELDVRRDKQGRWWIGSLEFRTKTAAVQDEPSDQEAYVGDIIGRLGEINFSNARLVWIDEYLDQPSFIISQASLNVFSDGSRHTLDLNGRFPEKFCKACQVHIDVSGKIEQPQTWRGRIYTEAYSLKPEYAPAIVRSRLPYDFSGELDLALRAELHAGQPRVVQGNVSGKNMEARTSGRHISVNTVNTDVLWRLAGDGWVFEANDMRLGIRRSGWHVGDVWFAKRKGEIVATVGAVNVADIGVLADMFLKGSVSNGITVSRFSPRGILRDINLVIPVTGEGGKFSYEASANFYELGWKGEGRIPSASGFDGAILFDEEGGSIRFTTSSAELDIPVAFRHPLEVDRLNGTARISRKDDKWEALFEDVDVSNRDIHLKGEALFEIPLTDAQGNRQAPYLNTRWKIISGRGNRASRYFPVNKLKPKLLDWMDKSIKDGVVTGGYAVFEGRLNQFPFRDNNGRFEVNANIEKGVLKFLPGWPALRDIDANLDFRGASMNITSNIATLNGMRLGQVSVTAEDFSAAQGRRLQINGRINGSGQSLTGVVSQVRNAQYAGDWARHIPEGIFLGGNNHIRLAIDYDPLTPQTTAVAGEIIPENMTVNASALGISGHSVKGRVRFDESGVSAGEVYAGLLGSSARFTISSQEDNDGRKVVVRATGGVTASGIAASYGHWLNTYLDGRGQWYGEFIMKNSKPFLSLEASLDNLVSRLPHPLHKDGNTKTRLTVTARNTGNGEYGIHATVSGYAALEVYLRKQRGKWKHHRGLLLLGEYDGVSVPGPGFHVMVNSSSIDLDAWRYMLPETAVIKPSSAGVPDSIQINTSQLELYDRRFGAVAAHVYAKTGKWHARLSGDAVVGMIDYAATGKNGKLTAELDHLVLPDETFREPDRVFDVRELPDMSVHVENFVYGDLKLGAMNLKAKGRSTGWLLNHAKFDSKDLHITAWGEFKRMGGRNHGDLEFTASSNNLGKSMQKLAMPGQVESGKAHASASLNWQGVDTYTIASATGKFRLKAENGSFLKLEQGAGKMLGIFDFDAFGRYARLDFTTLFGTGYAFDELKGSFDLERGHIYTRDLKIKGPSADMAVSGRVGLVDEDYDFVVGVNPSVSDTLAFASWGLGVPQVGAAILLFNRIFKKDIETAGRLTYLVQGTWEKPEVKKILRSGTE